MRLIIQRVLSSGVEVEGKEISSIGKGLLVLVGISKDFSENKVEWATRKITNLRVWPSEEKGFDLSVKDIQGEIMLVSQFTLHGDCSEGNKPNFRNSADFDKAKEAYEMLIASLENEGVKVKTGKFGAMMNISLVNDGPVTLILEK